ncbi:MAG: tRNA-guanine transglycosylase, partial [Clostridia bacterium]|nr:tRNA-guanine transglycosylase [Clostridia bacterium]
MQKQAKRLFWNALLLSAASLFIRTVGVSFQVLLAGRIGAEAMGLYTLMGGVYGFALTLATSGIQLGVTRRVTENVGEGHTERVLPTLRRATLYAAGFGLLAALLLLGTAKPIGLLWLKDARTVRPLRIFALTLPLIALSSVWNGYFSAVRRAYKSAMPTRNGRNGMLFTWDGIMNMKNKKWADDFSELDPKGASFVDHAYTKAYVRHLFVAGEIFAGQIASEHNLAF